VTTEAVVVGGLFAVSPAPEAKQSSISGSKISRANDSIGMERIPDTFLKCQRKISRAGIPHPKKRL
jgi:hypothetical protein